MVLLLNGGLDKPSSRLATLATRAWAECVRHPHFRYYLGSKALPRYLEEETLTGGGLQAAPKIFQWGEFRGKVTPTETPSHIFLFGL